MTLSEAQSQLTNILQDVSLETSPLALGAKVDALLELQQSLPLSHEFDVVVQTIQNLLPRLSGQITQAVLADLQSRHVTFVETASLLQRVGTQAKEDARDVFFEQPKLVLTTLSEAVSQLKEVRAAAQGNDLQKVGTKAEALISLVETTLKSVKTA